MFWFKKNRKKDLDIYTILDNMQETTMVYSNLATELKIISVKLEMANEEYKKTKQFRDMIMEK